ncbi:hypothetical protein JOD82_004933 [Paenibacillus sp. 1182]|nr:hypothetical protein [Paenibacillus sp. 1182]
MIYSYSRGAYLINKVGFFLILKIGNWIQVQKNHFLGVEIHIIILNRRCSEAN